MATKREHDSAEKSSYVTERDDELTDYFLKTFTPDRAVTLLKLVLDEQITSLEDFKRLKEVELRAMGFKMGDLIKLEGLFGHDKTPAANRDRVKNLISQIAQKYDRKKEKKKAVNPAEKEGNSSASGIQREKKAKTSRRRTDCRAHVGWLDYDGKKYTQVRLVDGGGTREIVVDDDTNAEEFKRKCVRVFFPVDGTNSRGDVSDYSVHLGNFQKNMITDFKNIEGHKCGIKEYLNCRGLYLSKTYFYIMTNKNSSSSSETDNTLSREPNNDSSCRQSKEVHKECSSNELKEASGDADSDERPISSFLVPRLEGHPVSIKPEERQIEIKYTTIVNSSYSLEVICTKSCYSRSTCYDSVITFNPDMMESDLQDFSPLDHGFNVNSIKMGGVEYFKNICDNEHIDIENNELLKYGPDTLWGYDGNELILAAVSGLKDATYTWYADEQQTESGVNRMCIAVHNEGTYRCVISLEDKVEMSKPLDVVQSSQSSDTSSSSYAETHSSIPVIDISSLDFSRDEENTLGEGGFGKVYKGQWHGTEIAIKEMKTQVRNRVQQERIIKNEVSIHSKVRHPNIVQIMCLAYSKKSVLLVSEYIEGYDLESAIFENAQVLEGKEGIYAKQICQAVAYLHGRNPQIIHQDIKPSNVLINPKTDIAKLCDLGLSKLKIVGAATTTCATSVPGTLMYMAPEGLLDRKTYVQSDIWALGCTLLELFTRKETWDIPQEADPTQFITEQMMSSKMPPATEELPFSLIKMCLEYDRFKRPSAVELIGLF